MILTDPARNPRGRLSIRLGMTFGLIILMMVSTMAYMVGDSYRLQVQLAHERQRQASTLASFQVTGYVRQFHAQLADAARGLAYTGAQPDRQLGWLKQVQAAHSHFYELSVTNAAGQEMARTIWLAPNYQSSLRWLADAPAVQHALEGNDYLGRVYIADATHSPFVQMAAPVYDAAQFITGALVAEVDVSHLWEVVNSAQAGRQAYVYVVDETGRLIAYRESELVQGPRMELPDVSQTPAVSRYLVQRAESRDIIEYPYGLLCVMHQQCTPTLAYFQPIEATGWGVIVEQPVQAAYAAANRFLWVAIGVTGGALLGMAVLAWYIRRGVLRPLHLLSQGAAALAVGQLKQNIAIHTGDEIEALANEFNTMAQSLHLSKVQLEEHAHTLEQRVFERTSEMARQASQVQTSSEVGQQISSILDLDELPVQAVHLIQRGFGYEAVSLWLLSETGDALTLRAGVGPLGPGNRMALNETGIIPTAARTNSACLAGDLTADHPPLPDQADDQADRPAAGRPGACLHLALPLRRGEVASGVLYLRGVRQESLRPEDVATLQILADQVANAAENARLFKEAQASQSLFAMLYEVGQLLASAATTEEVIQAGLVMTSYLGAEHSYLILFNPSGPAALHATLPTWRLFSPAQTEALVQRLVESGLESWVLAQHQPALVLDTSKDPRWLDLPELDQAAARSVICVPFFNPRGEVIGTLCYTHTAPQAFGHREQQLAEAIADQIALALENAHLYELAQRRAEEAETLRQAGMAVAATLQQQDAFDRILQELARVLPYDSASVQLLREGYLEVIGGRGQARPEAAVGLRLAVPGDNPNTVVIQERRPLCLSDPQSAYALFRENAHRHIRSWLGVPLLVREQVVGMLTVESAQANYFNAEHARLASAFAAQVAVALDNARLYQAAQQDKRYFESLVQNSPVAIVVVDPDNQVVSWNPAAEKLFGYSQIEAVGRTIDALLVGQLGDRAGAAAYTQQLAEGAVVHALTQRSRKDGSLVDVELLAVPVSIDPIGQVGALVIYHDVTELLRARQEAEAASRAKSAFLANMSHELRTPLNAILGFTQLMSNDARLTANQQENLRIIGRSGEHLLTLINDILEMSKIEAGRTTLHEHSFDLHRLLEDLQAMFHLRAMDKGLYLRTERALDVPQYIETDESKLRQVLVNLVSNAVKFTQTGGVMVRVGRDPAMETGPTSVLLCFEVEDSGPGIPPEDVQSIFDPFVQASSGRKSHEGTGLGLPISQQFVRLMGGELSVKSRVGYGSLFSFKVKVEVVKDLEAVALAPPPPRRVIGLQPGQPVYRLLIAEDWAVDRHLLTSLLTGLGPVGEHSTEPGSRFEVREAVNGQEALALWETWQPHLIWMDMRMPVLDGHAATQRIKSTPAGQNTIIVALTASAFEEDRQLILSEGCDGFVRKPFKEEEIFEQLSDHLGVCFVYEDQTPPSSTPGEVSLAVLKAMPAQWQADLQRAIMVGNMDTIIHLVEQVRTQSGAAAEQTADALTQLARDFDHDVMLQLIEQAQPELLEEANS